MRSHDQIYTPRGLKISLVKHYKLHPPERISIIFFTCSLDLSSLSSPLSPSSSTASSRNILWPPKNSIPSSKKKMSAQQQINCNKCKKGEIELLASLNKCNKCKNTFYCTRSCKKSDWEAHKKTCGKPTPNAAPSPNLHVNFAITPQQTFTQTSVIEDTDFGPMMTVTLTLPDTTSPDEKEPRRNLTQPDTSITAENVGNTKIWLSALPEQKCYESIIDAYRFRIEDEYARGDVRAGTLYDGSYPLSDFPKFLDRAQENDVLPDWWSQENKKSCQDWALDKDNDACILHPLERQDVVEKYGYLGLVQLRALAEDVYSSPVFG